jgi:hypothetical protein
MKVALKILFIYSQIDTDYLVLHLYWNFGNLNKAIHENMISHL